MTDGSGRADASDHGHPASRTANTGRLATSPEGRRQRHTHDAARPSLVIDFHGERGALWVESGAVRFCERPQKQLGSSEPQAVPPSDGLGERGVLVDFHRYVSEGVEPGISAHRNIEVMAMCEMMVRAIEADRPVRRDEL